MGGRRGRAGRRKGEGEQGRGEPSAGVNHTATSARGDSARCVRRTCFGGRHPRTCAEPRGAEPGFSLSIPSLLGSGKYAGCRAGASRRMRAYLRLARAGPGSDSRVQGQGYSPASGREAWLGELKVQLCRTGCAPPEPWEHFLIKRLIIRMLPLHLETQLWCAAWYT